MLIPLTVSLKIGRRFSLKLILWLPLL